MGAGDSWVAAPSEVVGVPWPLSAGMGIRHALVAPPRSLPAWSLAVMVVLAEGCPAGMAGLVCGVPRCES